MNFRNHSTPVVWWHVRHVLFVWTMLHLALPIALSFASSAVPMRALRPIDLVGADIGALACVLTVALTALDRRRTSAPMLANMGYSLTAQHTMTVIVAMAAELLLQGSVQQWT